MLILIQQRVAILAFALSLIPLTAHAYLPPESTPAHLTAEAAKRPLIAVTTVGKRVIAAGLRGNIVYSDDAGETWTQAKVPVSVDLVAIAFPTSQLGWAVGHSGVALNSADGGMSWTVQLDGKLAAERAVSYYQNAPEAPPGILEEEERQLERAQAGASAPFLDVFFDDDKNGYIVGPFNRIFHTADGGQTWEPWMHRVDNPESLHFYSIRRVGKVMYLAGEQGHVWKLGGGEQRFQQVRTPYSGTLFGVVPAVEGIIAFGMRGSAFLSKDEGLSWERLALATRAGIAGSAVLDDRTVFVTLAGEFLRQNNAHQDFKVSSLDSPMPSYYGIARLSQTKYAVVGPTGVAVKTLDTSPQLNKLPQEN